MQIGYFLDCIKEHLNIFKGQPVLTKWERKERKEGGRFE